MPITSYDQYMSEELGKGVIAEYRSSHADSKAAGGDIPFGVAVELGATNKNTVVQFAGGVPYGVAVARHFNEYVNTTDAEAKKYVQYEAVPVLRQGVIWVEVVEDVTAGQKAVADNATGNFRATTTDGTTTFGVEFPGAVYKSSAIAGGLAKLEINLP